MRDRAELGRGVGAEELRPTVHRVDRLASRNLAGIPPRECNVRTPQAASNRLQLAGRERRTPPARNGGGISHGHYPL
jgi:hypothetical protein